MSLKDDTQKRLAFFVRAARGEQKRVYGENDDSDDSLDERMARYHQAGHDEKEARQEIRRAFLRTLAARPNLLRQQKVATFLAEEVEAADFAGLEWQEPDPVVSFCENLNGFPFEKESTGEQMRTHASSLVRHALQQFEDRQEFEKMFQLLRLAPVSPSTTDSELLRLRNRAYLYEMRRVRRYRRLLHIYLIVQAILIVLVFPFLFINAENGRIQAEVEEATEVDLSAPEDQHQLFSYTDGLYWSLITAGSIGYGDITPKTNVGRVIAALLGVMGVITVGVIAGLILQWITPRRLE